MNENTDSATQQELEEVRSSLIYPDDLNWDAQATVLQHQDDSKLLFRSEDWTGAMEHQFAGLKAIFSEDAEQYIHDTAAPGMNVAYRFEPELRDGKAMVTATVHPAVAAPDGGRYALPGTVIAQAEISLEFDSARTAQLAAAGAWERTRPQHQPTDPAWDGKLPNTIRPQEVDITVLTRPEEASTLTGPDWRSAIEEDILGVLDESHTPATERNGRTAIFRFAFSVDADSVPTARGTLHPVMDGSMEMEENLDIVLSEATIRIETKEPELRRAMVSYIRETYG